MRVIGIDPGEILTWTIVDVVSLDEVHWVDSGTIASDDGVVAAAAALSSLMDENRTDLAAFELYDPGEWIGGARAGCAVATWQHAAMVAGRLMGWIGEEQVVHASAQTWRHHTVGKRTPKDSEVKHWLSQWARVVNLPKRCSADSRDAAGLAIYAARMHRNGSSTVQNRPESCLAIPQLSDPAPRQRPGSWSTGKEVR